MSYIIHKVCDSLSTVSKQIMQDRSMHLLIDIIASRNMYVMPRTTIIKCQHSRVGPFQRCNSKINMKSLNFYQRQCERAKRASAPETSRVIHAYHHNTLLKFSSWTISALHFKNQYEVIQLLPSQCERALQKHVYHHMRTTIMKFSSKTIISSAFKK